MAPTGFQLPRSAPSGLRSDRPRRRGRETPGPIDAYLYTERGVYRPGETVQIDGDAARPRRRRGHRAADLVATRPDGLEVSRTTIAGASLAGGHRDLVAASSARPRRMAAGRSRPISNRQGRCRSAACSSTSPDFVPQKLKVTLTAEDEGRCMPTATSHVKVESRFLYGAPASRPDRRGRGAHRHRSHIRSATIDD